MAMTKTKIVSNAVGFLGNQPITSLNTNNDLVRSAEQAYDFLLPDVLSRNNWRFACQIVQLSELVDTPPTYWKAIYQLPADFLKLIRLYPQNYSFEIYEGDKLYSMYSGQELFIEYLFQPSEALFPQYFSVLMSLEVAAYLAMSNAEKTEYYSAIEQRRINAMAMAAAIDNQNRPNFSLANFPVITDRNIGGILSSYSVSS